MSWARNDDGSYTAAHLAPRLWIPVDHLSQRPRRASAPHSCYPAQQLFVSHGKFDFKATLLTSNANEPITSEALALDRLPCIHFSQLSIPQYLTARMDIKAECWSFVRRGRPLRTLRFLTRRTILITNYCGPEEQLSAPLTVLRSMVVSKNVVCTAARPSVFPCGPRVRAAHGQLERWPTLLRS